MPYLISVGRNFGTWPRCSASSHCGNPRPSGTLDISTFKQQCYTLLIKGLAPSTCRSYTSAQTQSISFCTQLGKLHFSGSPCPADEWTQCFFATLSAAKIQRISPLRSIKQGFPDPLANCLCFQRMIRGIKHSRSSSSSSRLPITNDLMSVIWRSLDLRLPDHLMFWAACSLGYFGFLHASKFTAPSLASFAPSYHLGVQDIAVDSPSAPSCMRLKIKGSKTDPFRKGAFIHIDLGRPPQ